MKRLATLTLLICLLFQTTAFAQNSPAAQSPVNKNQVIARLLTEVDAGRDYIAQMEKRVKALEDEIARADQEHQDLTTAYKASLVELGELRATIKFQKEALSERESQVERLRTERDEARDEVKKTKKENLFLKLGYLTLILVKVLAH